MRLAWLLVLVCLLGTSHPALGLDRAAPARWTKALARTPDLTQTDPRCKFPSGGQAFCGPVAVANSFMRLAREGFPRLAPVAPRPLLTQIDIVRVLARPSHMATCPQTGTSTAHLIEGARRYVRDRGYAIERIAYQGWRPRPREVHNAGAVVRLAWLKTQVARPATAAWLNVGWYRAHDTRKDVWVRTGGHWVTLAGYGVDRTGQTSTNTLVLRDPSPRSGTRARYEFVTVRTLTRGRLEGRPKGLPRAATGMMRAVSGLAQPRGTTMAVVDGAVVLRLTSR